MMMLSDVLSGMTNEDFDKVRMSKLSVEEATLLRDERNALNSEKRLLARKERFYDLLEEKLPLLKNSGHEEQIAVDDFNGKCAVLQLSDIHYGLVCNNHMNTYNPDIAKERLHKLQKETLKYCKTFGIERLHIAIQGDLISGNIHNVLRVQNSETIIDQIYGVSELIANTIKGFVGNKIKVSISFVNGNHDRANFLKSEDLIGENFVVIVKHFIKLMCGNNVTIYKNEYGNTMSSFTLNGIDFVAVHGDKEPFNKTRDKICNYIGKNVDVILTAHTHTSKFIDDRRCRVISNGSVCGVDEYAENLRLTSFPSQNLIIIDENKSLTMVQIVL